MVFASAKTIFSSGWFVGRGEHGGKFLRRLSWGTQGERYQAPFVACRRLRADHGQTGSNPITGKASWERRLDSLRNQAVTLTIQDQFFPLPLAISTARSTAFALFSVSSNSRCGSESATIPAPACR